MIHNDINGFAEYHGIGLECSCRKGYNNIRPGEILAEISFNSLNKGPHAEHDTKILKDRNTVLNPALLPQRSLL